MDGGEREDVRPGLTVAVVMKQDQRTGRLTRGFNPRVLRAGTASERHYGQSRQMEANS